MNSSLNVHRHVAPVGAATLATPPHGPTGAGAGVVVLVVVLFVVLVVVVGGAVVVVVGAAVVVVVGRVVVVVVGRVVVGRRAAVVVVGRAVVLVVTFGLLAVAWREPPAEVVVWSRAGAAEASSAVTPASTTSAMPMHAHARVRYGRRVEIMHG